MGTFLSRVFGSGSSPKPSQHVSTGRDAATHAQSPTAEMPPEPHRAKWAGRDNDYWVGQCVQVLHRLRAEWVNQPEYEKWPDVLAFLDQLSAPPEDVMRQLPAAAREAMAMCENPELSRRDLADRLSKDPSLVQAVLTQANSAFYSAGLEPIIRVDAAIERIGVSGTRAVVLASCVAGMLSRPGPPYDAMLMSVWTHMVNCGPIARSVATSFGADPEEAFAVALLHDVGKLVMFDRISTLRTIQRKPVVLPDSWLCLAIAELHEPLGAIAAHRWGLGARAADAIGTHHRRDYQAFTHPLAESLFLAERAEHAMRLRVPLDLDTVWNIGQLSFDATRTGGKLEPRVQAA